MTSFQRIALDPVTVEIIGSALASVVEEMGEALVRTSYSTNIKERRDCATALFDQFGYTLCQAEHIPLHLRSEEHTSEPQSLRQLVCRRLLEN